MGLNFLRLKRSDVVGKIPAASDLALGEIALNTRDGKAFMKTSANAVVTLNPDQKIWFNGTLYQRSQMVEYVASGVTGSNGKVTFFFTQNGQSSGTPLFSQIVKLSYDSVLPSATGGATTAPWFNIESYSTTQCVLRGTVGRTMLLLGDSVATAGAGITVMIQALGLP